jgi:hypothetical protein
VDGRASLDKLRQAGNCSTGCLNECGGMLHVKERTSTRVEKLAKVTDSHCFHAYGNM